MIEAGNDAISLTIGRHQNGVRIIIQALPEVEAFFQHWGGGVQEKPAAGRLWTLRNGEQPKVWSLGLPNIGPSSSRPFSLLHTGGGLYMPDKDHPNISFLRLVGITAPNSQEIIVETVMGKSELVPLGQRLTDACNSFYSEYLQDVNIRGVVTVFRLPASAAA